MTEKVFFPSLEELTLKLRQTQGKFKELIARSVESPPSTHITGYAKSLDRALDHMSDTSGVLDHMHVEDALQGRGAIPARETSMSVTKISRIMRLAGYDADIIKGVENAVSAKVTEAKIAQSNEVQKLDRPISDIEPIRDNRGLPLTPADMEMHIESPVLAAVQKLYEHGIGTLTSSANRQNIGGQAYIVLKMENLSTVNDEKIRKLVAKRPDNVEIAHNDQWGEFARISVPLPDSGMSARMISERFAELVHEAGFLKQPAHWAKPAQYDEFIRETSIAHLVNDLPADDRTPQAVVEYIGVHYDAVSHAVYCNEQVAEYYRQTLFNAEPGTSTQVKGPGRLGR